MLVNENAVRFALYCKDCAPKPVPGIRQRDPKSFLGKLVKAGFPVTDSELGAGTAHMWVYVFDLHADRLVGRLVSQPVFDAGPVVHGSVVEIELARVEDVQPAEPPSGAVWVCEVCGEEFDHAVWHCLECDEHWPVSMAECLSCACSSGQSAPQG